MNGIKKVLANIPTIPGLLNNYKDYYAHTSNSNSPESLEDHCELVKKYLENIISKNSYDTVISSLLECFINENNYFKNSIKELFLSSIIFHDLGKINENFQIERLNNTRFNKSNNGLDTGHSFLGLYIFIMYWLKIIDDKLSDSKLSDEDAVGLLVICLFLSYPILKHHSSFLGNTKKNILSLQIHKHILKLKHYLLQYNIVVDDDLVNNLINEDMNTLFDNFKSLYTDYEFSLFSLLKLNYSLLTSSDYLATSHYMLGWNQIYNDLGLLDEGKKRNIIKYFYHDNKAKEYNKNLNQQHDYFKNYSLDNLQERKNDNLNIIRQKLAVEVIESIRNHSESNLFYLEAPTGSGKTNLSMIALVELLKIDIEMKANSISKVFYVFPFTTLITQTYTVIKETLGLEDSEIIELHSKAGFKDKNEEEKDGVYGSEKLNYIDNLFVNYPFCLLSHIRFFDILKGNKKENNYLLHRLANSIVIIDELQSYNPLHWDKIIYFISNYSKYFNIKFILMSATLPRIDKLLNNTESLFTELIPDSIKYFTNPNFKDRTIFDFTLREKKEKITLKNLSEEVLKQATSYSKTNKTNPDSVYVIIEFIFKKTASEFYSIIKNNNEISDFFEEIFVLSGTILEPRRKEIINFLKNKDNRKKKILLITTQVVEAGVDIDMDIGFKDTSLIDSDEQLAGRINRNVKKDNCILYLFKYDDPSVIYKNDERYRVTREKLSISDYKNILETKQFSKLYNEVMNKIINWNSSKYKDNFTNYKNYICDLNFEKVNNEFQLIDNDNISIYIPLEIKIEIQGSIDKNFTEKELNFLNQLGVNTKVVVDGGEVWKIYESIIHNKKLDFINKRISLKTLQGIMSKFIISIFAKSNEIKNLEVYGEYKYGFLYLWNYEPVYDYTSGIKDGLLDNFF
ncbi:MAG: CRISPR-associated helicase Cas3' [Leptospiraceae bacterium]|nr:CRISPR-associated helicase Cas3' [Leptospiraceae bacterium]